MHNIALAFFTTRGWGRESSGIHLMRKLPCRHTCPDEQAARMEPKPSPWGNDLKPSYAGITYWFSRFHLSPCLSVSPSIIFLHCYHQPRHFYQVWEKKVVPRTHDCCAHMQLEHWQKKMVMMWLLSNRKRCSASRWMLEKGLLNVNTGRHVLFFGCWSSPLNRYLSQMFQWTLR